MLRKCSRVIAYILTTSMLAGTCSFPVMASSTDVVQDTAVESAIEATEAEVSEENNAEDAGTVQNADNPDEQEGGQDQRNDEQSESISNNGETQDQNENEQGQNGDNQGQNENEQDQNENGQDQSEEDNETDSQNEGTEQKQEESNDDQNINHDDQNQNDNGNDGQNEPIEDSDPEEAKIDLSEAELYLDEETFVFDGNIPHPEVTVSLEGVTLVKDSEYEVLYDESSDIGIHVVTINGIGDYTGTAKTEYRIEKKEQKVEGTASYTKRLGDAAFELNTVLNGEGALVYGSNNNKVATVTSSGKVAIKGVGTAVISVYAKETQASKKSNVLKITVKVLKKVQKVTATSVYNKVLGQAAFSVNASSNGNGALKYSSNNNKVAVVDKNGKVTIKGIGIAKISVYAAETSSFTKSAAKAITIKVSPKKMAVSSVANTANNQITVKWKKQSGATGYQIQYSTKKDYSTAKTVTATASSVSKIMGGLTKNATYYVRIRSYKTAGSEKLCSPWSASKSIKIRKGTAKTFAKTPTIEVKAHDVELENTISWKKLADASGYEVYFKKGNNGSWKKAGATTGLSYTHKVGHGAWYYYKVRAYQNLADGSRIYGKFSKEDKMLQYYNPNFRVFMSSSTDYSTSCVVLGITNNGVSTLRIYSEGACLRDYDSSGYDRQLYLTKTSGGRASLEKAKYIDIKPGQTDLIAFEVIGNNTWYDKKTRVYYAFRYDGVDYVASSSSYYGTHYVKQ